MPTTKIPKLARNKYNYIEGVDGKKYVMQSQIMSSAIGGGGGGNSGNNPSVHSVVAVSHVLADRGVGPEDTIITDSYANAYFATATYLSTYYLTKDEISQAGYVTANELTQAGYITSSTLSQAGYVTATSLQSTLESYVTHQELAQASYVTTTSLQSTLESYVTQQELSLASYTTTTMVDEKLQDYSKTSVDKEENVTRTVTQNDGIIVLAATGSRSTTVTLPTTDIEDGKVIYIINKTGQAFTISTTGSIIDKDSSSIARATQTISDNVIQVIYYDGEWFVI